MYQLHAIPVDEVTTLFFDPETVAWIESREPVSSIVQARIAGYSVDEIAKLFKLDCRHVHDVLASIEEGLQSEPPCGFIHRPKSITSVVVYTTTACNLNCAYCYVDRRKPVSMSLPVASAFVQSFFANYPDTRSIQFFGGEPTLNFPVIQQVCRDVSDLRERGALIEPPTFGIVTNAFHLTDEMLDFFERYRFSVTVSLDGPRELHDQNRKTLSQTGSFDKVVANIDRLRGRVAELNIESTYTKHHLDSGITIKELYNFVDKSFGPDDVMVFPVSPGYYKSGDYILERNLEEINATITRMTVEMLRSGIRSLAGPSPRTKAVHVPLKIIGAMLSRTGTCPYYCTTCQQAMSIAPNGDIFPCFGFVGTMEFLMGNVQDKDAFTSDRYQSVLERFVGNLKEKNTAKGCDKCWARRLCWQCLVSIYKETNTLHDIRSYSCESLRAVCETILEEVHNLSKDPSAWEFLLGNVLEPQE
ncbi:MAG: radical SAM protein [Deltaproteobacteria bacterium]|nr:radical SAM protein [Deltaproteobacteria bacterium]